MGSYLYHVQFTLLNNHKLFQTLLQTFLKAIYTPILNYPLQQTSYVDAPPTELSIKEKEREERGRGRAATSSRRHDNLLCLYRRKEYSGDSNSWRQRVLQSFPKGTFSLLLASDLQNSDYTFNSDMDFNVLLKVMVLLKCLPVVVPCAYRIVRPCYGTGRSCKGPVHVTDKVKKPHKDGSTKGWKDGWRRGENQKVAPRVESARQRRGTSSNSSPRGR